KEVEVILDEIDSYKDSPSELIFDDFENLIFQNHPLGRNILGDEALLKQYTTADALRWTQRFYTPDNMIFFVRGDVDFGKVVKLAQKYMGGYGNQTEHHALYGMSLEEQSDFLKARSAKRRSKPLPYSAQNIVIDKDTHQAHVMIGGRGFDAYDEKRTALYLLNDILGGPGMNSRLNISLREKRGLVYSVESNITSYTDTGAFCIYFGCDEHDYKKCIRLVKSELLNLCNKPLSTAVLASAKKQIKGEIGVAADNFENTILSAAKCFLHYGKFESQAKLFKRIDNLTAETLQTVAQEVFADDKISTIIYT
ncbi:MAG: insulinase family protein, partial [Bacteroidaceae bacterium]|nr:insulinase family protein [Bacteroidaceae bacterium]